MNINKIKEGLSKSLENKIDISNRNVLIFGAGNTSLLYENCFKNENINISAFIDNNPEKKGKDFLGKKVISMDEINTYDSPVVLVCTINEKVMKEIADMLDQKKYEHYTVDEYVFTKNSNKIISVFDLLDDDKSKETYANMILARMNKKNVSADVVSPDTYFAINEFTKLDQNEVYVDCGAYVGDTIEEYIKVKEGMFGKVYAFEPDARNFSAMKYRVDRLYKEWALPDERITLVHAGVGEKTSKMLLNDQTTSSLGTSFSHELSDEKGIDVYALDDYFCDKKVSFIKADIESFEESMIRGAKKIIKRDKPLMAVCIYHNASDMYRIPLILNEFDLGYKISIRQHKGEILETVLYAY